jgi:EmrB/QacA subfamily drug resistance transporter
LSSDDTPSPIIDGVPRSSEWILVHIFAPVMLPLFLAIIDQTIVSTALPAIAAELGEVERISWVVISYLLTNTIMAPVYGRLGDILGRRRFMLAAIVVFALASLLCASAVSIETLTFARVLQGLGGGGLIVLSQALIGEALPPRERARYQGYLASVGIVAMTVGPVVGGYMTEHLGWRSIFMMNLPLGAAAFLLIFRLPQGPRSGARLDFDWPGLIFFAFFIAPMLLALEQLRFFNAQVAPLVIGMIAISLLSLWAFLRMERRVAQPLIPLALLRQPAIWRCSLLACFHGAAMVAILTFLPIYLRIVRDESATATGYLLLPFTLGIPIGSIVVTRMVAITGRTAVYPSWTLPVAAAILAGLAFWAPDLDTTTISLLFGLAGLCLSAVMMIVNLTVQIAAGQAALGVTAAATQISRLVGASFGTAIVGSILFAILTATDAQSASLFATIVEQGPSAMAGLPAARQAAIHSDITRAFGAAFLAVAAFICGGMVLSWTLPIRRLEEHGPSKDIATGDRRKK